MAEQPAQQMKTESGQNPDENLAAGAAGTRPLDRKRHGDQHHDRDDEGADELRPQGKFIARGFLPVLLEVRDIAPQGARRHLFRRDQQHAEDVRGEHRLPVQMRIPDRMNTVGVEPGFHYLLQIPGLAAAPVGLLGRTDPAEATVCVEAVNLDIAQGVVRHHFAHIDERAAILDPQAGTELLRHDGMGGQQLVALCRLLRPRRDIFADDQHQQRQQHTDHAEITGYAPVRQARHAHHRIFGIAHQARQREQGANQCSHRQDFIQMPGHVEHHHHSRLAKTVMVAAQRTQLLDHVEKRKQHQERQQHESRGKQDLPAHVAREQSHARLPRGAN